MQSERHFQFSRHFRLRGRIGGSDRTFPLGLGRNLIGRDPDCQIQIQTKGVSQHHAALVVGPNGLRLEDLRSKNGSFVNGAAVLGTHLKAGDKLWFGSTELLLEEVEGQEMELGVDLGLEIPTAPADALAGPTPTRRRWLDGELVARWFAIVEAVVEHSEDGEKLPSAVARIATSLGARTAAVFETDGSPGGALLAGCGEPDEALAERVGRLFGKGAAGPPPLSPRTRFSTRLMPGEGALTAALLEEPERRPLVLALQGEFPGRTECEAVFVALLRLVRRIYLRSDRPEPAIRSRSESRLVFPADYVPGISPAIHDLHAQMEPLGQGDLPVLISGETGVGKEHVARILHASSDRRRGPFIAINCAAVPAELLESELFGIGKGVATGVTARPGRFLQAQGGTLFLDEVGDLPAALQPKLLRALEERTVQPVGEAPVSIDVRIIAATNTELGARLGSGGFRADLYYRLAGVLLKIPPLRERQDDIPILVEHFLRLISEEIHKPIRGISVKALKALLVYGWPGNVRELVHEVRRLVYVSSEGEAIESFAVAEHIRELQAPVPLTEGPGESGLSLTTPSAAEKSTAPRFPDWLKQSENLNMATLECALLEEAMARCGGNKVQAGRLLGISRMAVRRRLDRCRKQGTEE